MTMPCGAFPPILRQLNDSMLRPSQAERCPVSAIARQFSRILVVILAAALISGCSLFRNDENYEELSAEQLYQTARVKMSKRQWNSAIEILRTLEAQYPYGVYAEQAQLDTIYSYYMSEQTGLSLAAADRFIRLNPTHASVDYAYYLKGLVAYTEDKTMLGKMMGQDDLSDRDAHSIHNALSAFEEVYSLFPDSQYAPESRKRAKYLRNALAKNEVAVARYYYTRGAHVAVVNRAKGVVENYSSEPAVEDALALMMFSYLHMGFNDLSGDTRRVLELNFPDSRYLDMEAKNVKFANSRGRPEEVDEDDGWYSSIKNVFSKDDEDDDGDDDSG